MSRNSFVSLIGILFFLVAEGSAYAQSQTEYGFCHDRSFVAGATTPQATCEGVAAFWSGRSCQMLSNVYVPSVPPFSTFNSDIGVGVCTTRSFGCQCFRVRWIACA